MASELPLMAMDREIVPTDASVALDAEEAAAELDDDRRLAARMAGGDAAAFDRFFQAHFHALFRYARAQVGGDDDLAADLAQATLCVALQRLGSYRGDASLKYWLQGICRFEITAHYRRKARRPAPVELSDETLAAEGVVERVDPEGRALQDETTVRVHRTLDLLPTRYGQVLELKYAERLSVIEIAARLGDSPKAIESLLSRARRAFKELFGRST